MRLISQRWAWLIAGWLIGLAAVALVSLMRATLIAPSPNVMIAVPPTSPRLESSADPAAERSPEAVLNPSPPIAEDEPIAVIPPCEGCEDEEDEAAGSGPTTAPGSAALGQPAETGDGAGTGIDAPSQPRFVIRETPLRLAPPDGAVLAPLHPGDRVILLDPAEFGGFVEVRHADKRGWVLARDLRAAAPPP